MVKIPSRYNLTASIIQNFPGGMSPDPLALACKHTGDAMSKFAGLA